MLGDKLKVKEYELWGKAKDRWEKNNLKARCERLAVNLPIQGGTASRSSTYWNLPSLYTIFFVDLAFAISSRIC